MGLSSGIRQELNHLADLVLSSVESALKRDEAGSKKDKVRPASVGHVERL